MLRPAAILSVAVLLPIGSCRSADRDNPVDPAAAEGEAGELSLLVALPKPLATVVDSLVARLEGPDMVTVVKSLEYDTPLGPATLAIGAVSPGANRTLTVEGYDLTGRLILAGVRRNITVVTGDTTRVVIDLRLTVDPSELDAPDTTAATTDTTVTEPDTTATAGDTEGDTEGDTTAPGG